MPNDTIVPLQEQKRRSYTLLFVVFSILLAVLVAYFLSLTHHHTQRSIEVSSLNEAHILSARADSTLRRIEASAQHVGEHIFAEMHDKQRLSALPKPIHDALTSLSTRFPEVLQTQVFDANGDLIYSSIANPVSVNIADRDHFREMKEQPRRGVYFTPVLTLKNSGRSAMLAYQAVIGTEGHFLGLVTTAIDLDYFSAMFSSLEVGDDGMVSIRRSDDSRLIVRWPAVPEEINKAAENTPPYQLIAAGKQEGVVRYIGKSDGVDRIFAFCKVPDYPFYILVGRAVEEQFAGWRHSAMISIALTIGALALLWSLILRLSRSEQALRETSLFLCNTQAIAHVGGWKANPLKNELLWTAEIYRLIGHPLAEPPKSLEDGLTYYAAEYLPTIKTALQRAWEDGVPFDCECEVVARGGRRFWVELRCVGRLGEGEDAYLTGTLQDISERKANELELEGYRDQLEKLVELRTAQLAASENNAKRILESSADGLYGIDRDGRVTFINPAACRILGYSPEQMIGQRLHPLIHHSYPDGTPYPEAECASHRAIAEGRGIRVDNEVYWHADGHPVPVFYAAHPISEGGVTTGAVVSFIDVSYQQAAEDARKRALLAAENLGLARSEFLANMSHEIRTPLNGVIGFADIGYRHCLDSDKARDAFAKIRQSGRMLLAVINDILDFSKIDAGKLVVESTETSLVQVVQNVMDIVAERAREKALLLEVIKADDFPEWVMSDPIRIQQVLVNLLTNAIKFTDTGSVKLSLQRDSQTLIFCVTDTGIGMTEEHLSRIFTPFEQADGSTTRRFGGTGLGLAIVKRIVDLMGGEVLVDSYLEQGSRFEVRLPFVPIGASSQAGLSPDVLPAMAERLPLQGIRILVAEDNEINQEILVDNLLEDGASVLAVANGRAAVERIRKDGADAYDIVLMDIQMPEMNGHEASREILRLFPDLPIVGQTAHAFAEEIKACFDSGMVGYIGKPIDPVVLTETVLKFAKRPSAGDAVTP